MKNLAFISGGLFSSLMVLAGLFKIMHWPGAGLLLIFSLAGVALIAIPCITKYLYDKNQ